jgi:hypothetical protein
VAEYETAVVRVRGWATGRPTVGLGLLVGREQVVTCAHVVNAALGRGQREQAKPGDDVDVQLEFPLLAGLEDPVRKGRVVAWEPPPRSGTGIGDVAGLTLKEPAPSGCLPARFSISAPEPGAALRVFGYPGRPSRESGAWVDVDLKGQVEGRLLQVESRADQTVKAQPGFSGSPVWDHSTGDAVGLLHAAPFDDDAERDAYLLAPPIVAQSWEEPFGYLMMPDNPYRGLEPFTPEYAAVFFARETDIAALAARVKTEPVVIVVGPTGVGKSSLVQAGLVPELQRQGWSVALVLAGQDPWPRLAAGLLRAANGPRMVMTFEQSQGEIKRLRSEGFAPMAQFLRSEKRPLAVVVDQFEELLPNKDAADRNLLDLLIPSSDSADEAVRLVLTLQSDRQPALESIPGFSGRLNERRLYRLPQVSTAQMRKAVEGPARERGVSFEEGLVDKILRDAGEGSLPLLEFTLMKLWETQQHKTLTFAGYNMMGGVRGALDRFAQDAAAELSDTATDLLDRVLLRLVRKRFEGADIEMVTCERIFRSEVADDEWEVIRRLDRVRLVNLDISSTDPEPHAKLAHESLITSWHRLRELVAGNDEFLDWLAWIQQRAKDKEKDPLPDDRIAEARGWLSQRPVPEEVRAFVESSETAAEARQRESRELRQLRELFASTVGGAAAFTRADGSYRSAGRRLGQDT